MLNRTEGYIYILLLITISFLFLQSVHGCDRVTPRESDLVRYPDLDPFLQGREGFEGITHDVDTGYYAFRFHSTSAGPQEYFDLVHMTALAEGWKLYCSFPLERTYRRASTAYPAATHEDQVTLVYSPGVKSVLLIMERAWPSASRKVKHRDTYFADSFTLRSERGTDTWV